MKYTTYIIIALISILLSACDENYMAPFVSKYPSVDERFMISISYNNLYGYVTIPVANSEYTIYVCTDTHVTMEEGNKNLKTFIDLYKNDKTCPVACCLGDLVEADQPYTCFVDAFEGISTHPNKRDTMFVAIGNHDIFYNQWSYYHQFWPSTCYYFVVKASEKVKDLYICLDTATGTLGSTQMEWLRYVLQEADKEAYRHIIVFTHINLFRRDNTSGDISTTSIEETYELISLFRKHKVKQFWAGHDHSREEFMHGNVKYIIVDTMEENNENASFMILHVGEELNNTFHHIKPFQQEMYP